MVVQVLKVLEGHTGPVNDVVISPDGANILSASVDKTVRVWSMETGQVLHATGLPHNRGTIGETFDRGHR